MERMIQNQNKNISKLLSQTLDFYKKQS
jgi:hypothetical protein